MNKRFLYWYFMIGNVVFSLLIGNALFEYYGFWISMIIGAFCISFDYLKFKKELWLDEPRNESI